eukprot:CAMPEP_0178439666 /NCGR_PEP_ID=MMETSP0689_2-20121128/36288_1 /TAXON_ID=160604 /ORGANISM="Amphidinium massartii, Strain CS-259" /LENGTH=144 /DNA_ID=CAMNT_0020062231 /DNA_START=611 /DNA_END=1045 /DNA_ORIENTATION=+
MLTSLHRAFDPGQEFLRVFALLFGWTLSSITALLTTGFWAFHTWLMLKAMTTIEFCEKSSRGADAVTRYNKGWYANVQAVLGDRVLLWFLPVCAPGGDILQKEPVHETTSLVKADAETGNCIPGLTVRYSSVESDAVEATPRYS